MSNNIVAEATIGKDLSIGNLCHRRYSEGTIDDNNENILKNT